MTAPDKRPLPDHVAIVMDGNGRWAEQRKRPRSMGHNAGVRALRRTVEHCIRVGIPTLTVFAFSSENWKRPKSEVHRLLDLFMRALEKEVAMLRQNGVRLGFIGERSAFSPELQDSMTRAEQETEYNTVLRLNVAANYGGRWDITQAARRIARSVQRGEIDPDDIDEALVASRMTTEGLGDPDLFIRTGGEMRVSNFLLWQAAYAEFWFTEVLWPDFGAEELDLAIEAFQNRERRYGLTGKQVRRAKHA